MTFGSRRFLTSRGRSTRPISCFVSFPRPVRWRKPHMPVAARPRLQSTPIDERLRDAQTGHQGGRDRDRGLGGARARPVRRLERGPPVHVVLRCGRQAARAVRRAARRLGRPGDRRRRGQGPCDVRPVLRRVGEHGDGRPQREGPREVRPGHRGLAHPRAPQQGRSARLRVLARAAGLADDLAAGRGRQGARPHRARGRGLADPAAVEQGGRAPRDHGSDRGRDARDAVPRREGRTRVDDTELVLADRR